MPSTKPTEPKPKVLNFDPAQFQKHNGTARPLKKPAPPQHSWGVLQPEDVAGYLASPEWAARKAEYFDWVRSQGVEPACQVCYLMLKDVEHLDVHHHDYSGILAARPGRGQYISWESHDKLVPLCRAHHAQVHKHLAKLIKERGYLVSDSGLGESREAVRAVRRAYEKTPAHERLGLILTSPPTHTGTLPYGTGGRRSAARR